MLKVQAKVLDLLREIDEICAVKGIGYSLAGRTAAMYCVSGGFTGSDYLAEIMMTPDDYKIFRQAASIRRDRFVESLENNPHMDGFYARYVDTSTTLLDMKRGAVFKARGICVNIIILRSRPLRSRYRKALNTVVRTNGADLKVKKAYSSGRGRLKVTGLAAARAALGTKRRMKSFFADAVKDDGSSKNYFYYSGKDKISVPRKWMADCRRVLFEGVELSALAKTEELTEKIYGKDLKKALRSGGWPANEWGVYYDTEHPYTEVMREAEAEGTDFARLARERADYDEFSAKDYRKKLSKADREYYYVWRTINRFRLLEELGPRTEEIAARYGEGRIDEVRGELADYIEQIENYASKGMGFSFDTELFDIACRIMEQDGKAAIVKKAKKLLPEEFKEPLADYLQKQGRSLL